MGNTTRTAGEVLFREMLLDRAGDRTNVFDALDEIGVSRAASRAIEDGRTVPDVETRAMLDVFSAGQVPTIAWERAARMTPDAARHVFRVRVRAALREAFDALDRAVTYGYRTDCAAAAVKALDGALANIYHEDACAVMGCAP